MQGKQLTKGKEFRAILGSTLSLVSGFLVLWIAKTAFNVQQDAVLVSLMLIPVLLYLILSGTLQEFSAGGVSAKFTATAGKPIKDENLELLEMKTLLKDRPEKLDEHLQDIQSSPGKYFTLGVILGYPGYSDDELLRYLGEMSRYPNFKFLIILEQVGRSEEGIFAFVTANRAIQILQNEISARNSYQTNRDVDRSFLAAIYKRDKIRLVKDYGFIKPIVLTTNLEALKKMAEQKIDVLIVTDENGILQGFVEREQLLSKLILALTK